MCVYMLLKQEGRSEKVEVSNLGIAKKGPVIVEENQLMLEYTNGSVCQAEGVMTTYTTRIHFVCSSGTAVSQYCPFTHLVLIINQWLEQYENNVFFFSHLVLTFWRTRIAPLTLFGTQKQPAPSQPLRPPTRSTFIFAQIH